MHRTKNVTCSEDPWENPNFNHSIHEHMSIKNKSCNNQPQLALEWDKKKLKSTSKPHIQLENNHVQNVTAGIGQPLKN